MGVEDRVREAGLSVDTVNFVNGIDYAKKGVPEPLPVTEKRSFKPFEPGNGYGGARANSGPPPREVREWAQASLKDPAVRLRIWQIIIGEKGVKASESLAAITFLTKVAGWILEPDRVVVEAEGGLRQMGTRELIEEAQKRLLEMKEAQDLGKDLPKAVLDSEEVRENG